MVSTNTTNSVSKFFFSSTMFLSTSANDRKIYLWDEKVCSTVFNYEDAQNKTAFSKIIVINDNLFSNYIIATMQNKSLITIFDTSNPDPIYKTVPLDEPITAVHSNNKLIVFGSTKGNISVFDLSSGNVILFFQVSFNPISSVFITDDNSIIAISSELVKLYTFNQLMNNKHVSSAFNNNDNNSILKEYSSVVNSNSYMDIFYLKDVNNTIVLVGDSKVSVFDYPKLEHNLLNIFFDDQITHSKINKNDMRSLYVSINNKIYLINIDQYLKNSINTLSQSVDLSQNEKRGKDTSYIQNIISQKDLPIVISMDDFVVNFEIGSHHIALAKESGEVHLFNLIDYKFVNKFSQMKGMITNMINISRPISLYGLNYNKNLVTTQLAKLEKMNNVNNKQIIVNGINENDYVSDLIDDFINEI